MAKRKKYITLILLLTFVFYSSGQALLLHHCDCHKTDQKTEAKHCCCETNDQMEDNCHSIEFLLNSQSIDHEDETCQTCSEKCVQPENFDADIPIVLHQISFELQNNIVSKVVYNLDNDDNNHTTSKLRPQDSDQYFIPIQFGKNLLIKLNSLKIPAHIS